ncbi:MAG TPA: prepilin-type N-terminal cleavage/methylation domain-containing protein [Nitrospirae bacterium]|nr:prepilin-type N-terminal cleavage/methylation domain-containing protein [Nitrospirota bacterium]HDZ00555.1 prepilin-type N-terminal cleavage/methylation domain-containing protein [Nitrospirota bacterium]
MRKRREGFTLIEVIIAMMLLSIGLVMIMQLFSRGLKAARTSCDYTKAIILAKGKMEELSYTPVSDSGEFEKGFRWESEVLPYKELEETGYNLMELKIKVSWDDTIDKQKSIELVSLKAILNEEEL